MTPNVTGITTVAGLINQQYTGSQRIYGSEQEWPTQYFALNHRGYIFAKMTGTYTFDAYGDDIVLIWIGPDAYKGWTRKNAFEESNYGGGESVKKISLQQDEYYAFRVLYLNAQGIAIFNITVTAPDGTVFFGTSSAASPYLVQYSCDGVVGPKYPAFGQEN